MGDHIKTDLNDSGQCSLLDACQYDNEPSGSTFHKVLGISCPAAP
jgi:hypothetical protein